MKKKLILISVAVVLLIAVAVYMFQQNKKEDNNLDGNYVSETNELNIIINKNIVSIEEIKENYLHDKIYDRMFNENMDKESFENFVQQALKNMKKGVEYVEISNKLVFWPVEGDSASFQISKLEDGEISFINQIYNKK